MTDAATSVECEHQRAAQEALRAWDVQVANVKRVSVSENIVFRVESAAGKPYVLRLHRPGYHTLKELVSEQMWTRALIDSGIDAPLPVATRSGQGYAPVEVAGEQRHAGLLEWVEGETLDDVIEAAKQVPAERSAVALRFVALGTVIAAIHNHAATWRVPDDFARHALDADGFLGEAPFWGRFWESPHLTRQQRRLLEALRQPIHDILSGYGTDPATYSLIHADLHPGNVVVQGERLHVIDFDDAGFGWHPYECAVALYHYRDVPRFEDLQAALVAGYRAVRPIADAALALIPLFMLVRSLASIGWAAARPELRGEEQTAYLVQEVENRADATLAALRR